MKICCIKTSSVPRKIKDATDVFTVQYADFIRGNDIDWIERSEAETDKDFQQIIPYVLVKNSDGKFASYTRHGNEKRLHGKLSCGIGGHIDETDKADSFDDTLANGMCRELYEELKDFDRSKVKLSYLGIINEIESDVGEVHLGLVFLMECNDGYVPTQLIKVYFISVPRKLYQAVWNSGLNLHSNCLIKFAGNRNEVHFNKLRWDGNVP